MWAIINFAKEGGGGWEGCEALLNNDRISESDRGDYDGVQCSKIMENKNFFSNVEDINAMKRKE